MRYLFNSIAFLFFSLALPGFAAMPISGKGLSSEKINLDIPAQSLSTSLLAFATQSNIQTIVDYSIIENLSAPRVYGHFSVNEALSKLLEHTSLTFVFDKALDVLMILKQPEETLADTELSDMPSIVEEVVITGLRYPFNYNTISHSHLHSNLSRYESSRFFTSITHKLINDQESSELGDLLRNSSAIGPADGLADTNDDFYIRGFKRDALYINNFRLDPEIGAKLLPFMIDTVEVLKGPSTLHYGQSEPGGVVSAHFRRPDLDKDKTIRVSIGENNQKQVGASAGGNISPSISFGLISIYESVDENRDLADVQKSAFLPSMNIDLGEKGLLDFIYMKQASNQINRQGSILLVPDGGTLNFISVDTKTKQAKPEFTSDMEYANAQYFNQINSVWNIQVNYFSLAEERKGVRGSTSSLSDSPILIDKTDVNPNQDLITIFDSLIPIDVGTLIENQDNQLLSVAKISSIFDESGSTSNQFLSVKSESIIELFSATNSLVMGVDYYQAKKKSGIVFQERKDIKIIALNSSGTTNALDVVDIVFDDQLSDVDGELINRSLQLEYNDLGLYIDNNIELGTDWIISLGSRYSYAQGELLNKQNNSLRDLGDIQEFSSQLGVVYKLKNSRSLYWSYSEGLRPNYLVGDFSSGANEPERSYQFELGIKWSMLDGRMLGTAAVYTINKDNIAEVQFEGGVREISTDLSQQVYGGDFDFTYQVNDRFDLIGSASLLRAEILSGKYSGFEPPMVASATASIFGRYSFDSLPGLHISLGSYFVGDRYGDKANKLVLPAFGVLDLGLAYDFMVNDIKNTISLSVKNLLNEDYLSSIEGGIRASQGLQRTVAASITVEF